MEPETVLKRSQNATFEVVAGEAILIRMDTGTYFSLNKIGTEFWQLLDEQRTIREHAATIAGRYSVESGMVTSDLLELAEKLVGERLAEIV